MNPEQNAGPRHPLRWVLGAAFVFIAVVVVALDKARSRASERWLSVKAHWADELHRHPPGRGLHHTFSPRMALPLIDSEKESGVDDFFSGWRGVQWAVPGFTLALRQERAFFGNRVDARLSGCEPEQIEAVRASSPPSTSS